MKIPLRELEQARHDPGAYLRKRERQSGNDFFRKSKYRTLQRAALYYHDVKGDLEKAKEYLQNAYDKQFKDKRSLQANIEKLENYAAAFQRLGNSVFKVRDRLTLSLPERISRELSLTAEIPRLDLTSAGYAVWMFSKEPADLKGELRLPLIQETYSKKLSADLDEVTVGVYDFATSNYEAYAFTQREINRANAELQQLVDRLIAIARPRTLREL
jgi:hypothetical protein